MSAVENQTLDEQYATQISNAVYNATGELEFLTDHGLIDGSGHHLRQEVAKFAADLVKGRWIRAAPNKD